MIAGQQKWYTSQMPRSLPTGTLQLQDRDIALLLGLFDTRLMTLSHAALLYFDGRHEAAKKRIQKLKAGGLVGERARKVYEPSIIFLAHQGFLRLQERGRLTAFPHTSWPSLERRLQVSPLTLRHEIDVLDVKAAFCSTVRTVPSLALTEFSTWPVLFQFHASPDGAADILVRPDSYVRLDENAEDAHAYFVEVDRSTETIDTLASKALCYLDYYRRGGFAARHGQPRSKYKEFPFRVLMIFKTAERRNNMAERY